MKLLARLFIDLCGKFMSIVQMFIDPCLFDISSTALLDQLCFQVIL